MPIRFREEQFAAHSHAIRVFVEGEDVTSYLTSGVDWSIGDENSCSFTLSNAADSFVINQRNTEGRFNSSFTGPMSEAPKQSIYRRKLAENVRLDPETKSAYYQLFPGRSIFHYNDRVRVFYRHPTIRQNRWLPAFAGFLHTGPVNDDYLTGKSSMSVSCADVRGLMENMRTQTNAMNPDHPDYRPEPLFEGTAGIFSDFTSRPMFSHVLAGLDFLQTTRFLLTGGYAAGMNATKLGSRGVGGLTEGFNFRVTPQENDTFKVTRRFVRADKESDGDLESWCDLCTYGVTLGGVIRTEGFTDEEMMGIGRGTYARGPYDPLRAFVHYLLPASGTGFESFVEYNVTQILGADRSFSSRKSLVEELCEKIQYKWRITPFGDMVFEFPMGDFEPKHYGDYQSVLEGDRHVTSVDFGHENSLPPTAITATGGILFQEGAVGNIPNAGSGADFPQSFIMAPVLASRIGVITETLDFPFTGDVVKLCQLATAEFYRRLANANSFSCNIIFRPGLDVNRPFHERRRRDKMGLIESVNYSVDPVGLSASASISLTLPRDRLHTEGGAPGSFHFMTGGVKAPISYRQFAGTGQLIGGSADTGLTTRCKMFGDKKVKDITEANNDARRIVQNLSGTTEDTVNPKKMARQLIDRNQLHELAVAHGVTDEVMTLAIMAYSETGGSAEASTAVHTVFNRFEANRGHKGASSRDVYESISNVDGMLGSAQSGEDPPYASANGVRAAIASAAGKKDTHFDRSISAAQSVMDAYQSGTRQDPVDGATNFVRKGAATDRVREAWERRHYSVVSTPAANTAAHTYFTPKKGKS